MAFIALKVGALKRGELTIPSSFSFDSFVTSTFFLSVCYDLNSLERFWQLILEINFVI